MNTKYALIGLIALLVTTAGIAAVGAQTDASETASANQTEAVNVTSPVDATNTSSDSSSRNGTVNGDAGAGEEANATGPDDGAPDEVADDGADDDTAEPDGSSGEDLAATAGADVGADEPTGPAAKLSTDLRRLARGEADTVTPQSRFVSGQDVTVTVRAPDGLAERAAAHARSLGDVGTTYRDLVEVTVPIGSLEALADDPSVNWVSEPDVPVETAHVTRGVDTINATDAQARGYNGTGVHVAVIDSGFDPSDPEIASNVVEQKDFTGTGFGGNPEHGTASAQLVNDTAPNVSLHVYKVGSNFDVIDAIDHIEDNRSEIDVVTMSLGFPGVRNDGEYSIDQRIDQAVGNDSFVHFNSAGNYGQFQHWSGTWNDPNGNFAHNFTTGTELPQANLSADEEGLEIVRLGSTNGNPIDIRLQWDQYPSSGNDYDLILVNATTPSTVLDTSTNPQTGSQPPEERVVFTPASTGQYRAAVVINTSGGVAGTADFDLWSPSGSVYIERETDARSVSPPGTAVNATTIGAIDSYDDSVEAFSSRGPTIDGRTKPDISAPDNVSTSTIDPFFGTSAASPYAAGAAALMYDWRPSLTPEQIESYMTGNATPITGTEPDNIVGAGLVDVNDSIAPTAGSGGELNDISSCRTIDAGNAPSDGVVNLTSDITGVGSTTCINITVSDVTLLGHNHTVGSSGGAFKRGIEVTNASQPLIENVTVANVTLTDWQVGVNLTDVDDGRVNDSLLVDNTDGVDVSGIGIGTNVTGNEIRGGNNGIDGRASQTEVVDNVVQNASLRAVRVRATGLSVRDNDLTGSGFGVASSSSDAVFESNNLSSSTGDAVSIFTGGDNNTFRNTTALNSGDWVIDTSSVPTNNTFTNLTIGASSSESFPIDVTGRNMQIAPNASPAADPAGVDNLSRFVTLNASSSDAWAFLNVSYDPAQVSGSEGDLEVWKWNRSSGWVDTTNVSGVDGVNTAEDYVYTNTSEFSVVAPMEPTAGPGGGLNDISSCRTINASNAPSDGLVNLTSDITNAAPSSCINVTVGDITLDGQGFTVDGDGSGGVGINVSNNSFNAPTLVNVTVRNVTVTDWTTVGSVGIEYIRATDGLVTDVNATDNFVGISIANFADRNVVNDSLALSNADNGVEVRASASDVTIASTNASNNGDDGFAATAAGSVDVRFRNLTAVDNTNDGFFLGVDNGSLVNGTARRNGDAFRTPGPIVSVDGLDIGASTAAGTTVDFDARNVRVDSASTVPADPADTENISRYVFAAETVPPSFLNLTVTYNDSDVASVDESRLAIWKENGSWTELGAGPATDAAANEIQYNVTNVGSVFAPLANTTTDNGTIDQCRAINASNRPSDGLVEVTSDITASVSPCIPITTSNVTLDGRGNTVSAAVSPSSGIDVQGGASGLANITVRNVTVNGGFTDAIDFDGATRSLAANVTSENNFNGVRFLDANDSTIRDSLTRGNTEGVSIGRSANITVRNTTHDGDDDGVAIDDSDDTTLSDLRVMDSTRNGIFVVSDGGINSANGTVIEDGTFVNGSGLDGIRLSRANHTVIQDVIVEGVTSDGVNVTAAGFSTNTTLRNVSSTTSDNGVFVEEAADVVLRDVNASANGGRGLMVLGPSGSGTINVSVRESRFNNNSDGMYVSAWGTANVRNATANDNINNGFALINTTRLVDVQAKRNLASAVLANNGANPPITATNLSIGASSAPDTRIDGEFVEIALAANSSPPADPAGEQNIGRYVELVEEPSTPTPSISRANLTFHYTDGDVSGVDESALDIWKNNASQGWTEFGTGPATDAAANEIQFNVTSVGSVVTPLAASTEVNDISSCRTINASNAPSDGLVNLTADITDSPAPSCINVTVSDVTLAGGNHTVDGTPSGTFANGTGVLVTNASTGISNVTVRNVTVTDWDQGVRYDDVSGGAVRDLFARFNAHHVYTTNTADNLTVADNVANDTVSSNSGLRIGGFDNLITGNLLGNSRRSIRVSAISSVIEQNTVVDEQIFAIEATGSDTVVRNNTVRPSTLGIQVRDARNVTVRDNEIDGSVYGASTSGVEVTGTIGTGQNSVIGNNVTQVGGDGIRVEGDNDNTTLRGNDVTGAGQNGTVVLGVNGTAIDGGLIDGSGDHGIDVRGANGTIVEGGITVNGSTAEGLQLAGTNDTLVRDATVTEGGDDGILVTEPVGEVSDNVTLRNVTASRNFIGMQIGGGPSDVAVLESNASANDRYGITSNANGAVIRNTTVVDNDQFGGLSLSNAEGNLVADSNVSANVGAGVQVINDGRNNTFDNVSAVANTGSAVSVGGDPTHPRNTTFTGLDVGASTAADTTIDAAVRNVSLAAVSSPPADPADEQNITRFVDATSFAGDSYLNVTFRYDAGDVAGVDESRLDVWKHNGSWTELGAGPATDAGANVIQYNVTNVGSVFAPLANTTTAGGELNDIGSCRTINASNAPSDGLVNLTQDINDATPTSCINVTVSEITLDGQGHLVDGDGDDGVGVNVTNATTALDNVTVRDMTATDWGVGGGGDAIRFSAADGLVTDVNASNNFRGMIVLSGADRTNVTDSIFNDNAAGVDVDAPDVLLGNVTASNNNFGIQGSSTITTPGFVIRNSTVENNNVDGLGIAGTAAIFDTAARGNDPDLDVSDRVVTAENLDIGASAAANTELDLSLKNVALAANTSPPTDPTDERNISRFVEATNNSASHFLNVSFQYTNADVAGVDESRLDVWKHNGSWTELGAGPATDAGANVIQYNVTDVGSVFAPLANTSGSPPPSGGLNDISSCRTIDASNAPSDGLVNLTSDIVDATPPTCINVTVSDVTFDGQGHEVDGVGAGGSVGVIAANASTTLQNVTIRNVASTQWGTGVEFDDVNDGAVVDTNASNDSYGVRTTSSAVDVNVTNVTAVGSAASGIQADGDRTRVRDSEVRRSDGAGYGIFVTANDSVVAGNDVRDSRTVGITVSTANDVRIVNNDINDTNLNYGIRADSAHRVNITGNEVTYSASDGVLVSSSLDPVIHDNLITDNNQGGNINRAGLYLDLDTGATVTDNRIHRNAERGVRLDNAVGTVLRNNQITENCGNQLGLELYESDDTLLVGNNVSNNTGGGIQVSGGGVPSQNTTFRDTRVLANQGVGGGNAVALYDADDVRVINATIAGNVNRGLHSFASNVSVVRSAIASNGDEGAVLRGSDTVIRDSAVRDNGLEDLSITSASSNSSAENVSLGASTAPGTRFDLGGYAVDVEAVTAPPADPSGERNVSRFLQINETDPAAFANLTFRYEDGDVVAVNESALDMWKYNATDAWTELGSGPATSTGANLLQFNVTDVGSIFAPLANTSALTGPANVSVAITGTNSPITEGDTLDVDVRVGNNGGSTGTQTINLTVDGSVRDSQVVTLASGTSQTITLSWPTSVGENGSYTATVDSANDSASAPVTVQTAGGGGPTVGGGSSNDDPYAALSIDPRPPETGETATFDAGGSSDPDGHIVTYRWTIDGTQYSGEEVDVTFSDARANHVAELTVIDDGGASDTARTQFLVTEPTQPSGNASQNQTQQPQQTQRPDDGQEGPDDDGADGDTAEPDDGAGEEDEPAGEDDPTADDDDAEETAEPPADEGGLPWIPVLILLLVVAAAVGYWYVEQE